MRAVEITYELTEKDFYGSIIAHRNRSTFTKWTFRVMLTIAFLAAALAITALVLRPTSETLSNAAPLLVIVLLWVLCKWGSPWWTARTQFRKQPSAQGPRTLQLDSIGVHWRWDGGTADIEWKNITRFLETRNEFLLYTSPAAFNPVPKRALTSEQISQLRSLLSEHLDQPRK